MCRIAGIVNYRGSNVNQDRLRLITDEMWRGGPDGSGYWFNSQKSVGLGHRRLSIIDLSEHASQPFLSNCRRYTLVFNGEIYNYSELKVILQQKGYVFNSLSDTEVFLNLYIEFGEHAFHQLEGMWTAAIWDDHVKCLILVRDRLGAKPLYYRHTNSELVFASELKSILVDTCFDDKISVENIQYYLLLGYFPKHLTPFKGVFKLSPGSFLRYSPNREIHIQSWWNTNKIRLNVDWNDTKQVVSELEERLISSFSARTVSDVPIGVFLSGGIDSSLVASMLTKACGYKLKTFTVGFSEEEFDESPRAALISQSIGSTHYSLSVGFGESIPVIENIPEIWNEPLADSSCIPTFLLSQFAARYVKVALSADGGDELFGGYPKYWLSMKRARLLAFLSSIPKSAEALAKLATYLFSKHDVVALKLLKAIDSSDSTLDTISSTFLFSQNLFTRQEVKLLLQNSELNPVLISELWHEDKLHKDHLNDMMRYDLNTYLPDDILAKVDRASMYNGLEAREPFLGTSVIELAMAMPSSLKIPNLNPAKSKNPLRILQNKYLPDLPVEHHKRGFGAPFDIWLVQHGNSYIDRYLSHDRIRKYSVLNPEAVSSIVNQFKANPRYHLRRLWCILTFQMWCEKWL